MNTRYSLRGAALAMAIASTYVPVAAAQQQPSNADLGNLVRQQAAQIQRLQQRVDQLETSSGSSSRTMTNRPSGASSTSIAQPSQPGGEVNQRMSALQKRVDTMEKEGVKVDWSDGAPELSSPDGQYTFGIGGRIQYDFSNTSGSDYDGDGDLNSRNITGTEFRRLRLDAHGKITDLLLYKLELDFANDSVGLRDAYIAAKKDFELGSGVVYVGSKFSDRSFDGRTSSKWTWFTERNTVANAIQPESGAYATGVTGEFYGDQDWHISLAVTKGSNTGENDASNNLTILSRAHIDPINTGNTILHLGANGFYENFEGDRVSGVNQSVTIGGHYNENLRIVSDTINADTSTAYGFELGGLSGPFAFGAEYGRRDITGRSGAPDTHYDAYSGQIGFSLTGEMFGYSTKQGVWTRPDIDHPVNEGGIGAWQLMARYEALDFRDNDNYRGGTGHGTTVGLSWYLNDYARVLLDYTRWRTNNRLPIAGEVTSAGAYVGNDNGNSVNARAQIVF